MAEQTETNIQADDIKLIDLLIVLAKYKKIVLGFPLGVAIITAIITLTIPNTFTATTRILPPQGQSSTSAMLAQQLGSLAGLASSVIKTPNDVYVGMLKSRTVADNLIQRFDLNKLYEQEFQSSTRKQLERRTDIISGKLDGIITIEVDDKDPSRAAEIANAYVEELYKLTKVLAVTEASQRRLFFERQLLAAKDNLAAAEVAARQAFQTGGLVQVEGQGRALMETTARLRGQISVKEVELSAMRTFAADRNPALQVAQNQLEAMKHELSKMEGTAGKSTVGIPDGKSEGVTNYALMRNVRYYETMYELLGKQFELAKIEEARDSSVVQVMDKAIEPDRKSKPFRALIVVVSALVAGFIAVVWAFVLHAIAAARENPEQAQRLALLRHYLRISRSA